MINIASTVIAKYVYIYIDIIFSTKTVMLTESSNLWRMHVYKNK